MKGIKNPNIIRMYLMLLSIARIMVLIIGMGMGFKMFFPNTKPDIHLLLFALVLIIHWIVVIFYHSIKKGIIFLTVCCNIMLFAISGIQMKDAYGGASFGENICFGNELFLITDIILLIYLGYSGSLNKKRNTTKPML